MRMRGRAEQSGVTLLELLIALVVFSVVIGAALGVFRSQAKGFRQGTLKMSVLQNIRFTAGLLERELRTMGSGALETQPFVIYAGADVVAFNADYATNVANDVFAVYFDPEAPTGAVTAMTKAQRAVLPGTAMAYPDTNYTEAGGVNGRAETITLFFSADTSTARGDDYALYRQVNYLAPELITRNLVRTDGGPFFTYFRSTTPPEAPAGVQAVSASSLPLRHAVPIHLSPADTGSAAVIDSIRGVRMTFTAVDGSETTQEYRRAVSRMVWLPNAGLATRRTCGDEPMLGTALAAAPDVLDDGRPAATLTWGQAVDEAGGEQDVVRYVVWRRFDSQPDWGDPYLSLPAGNATYVYTDAAVEPGSTYVYSLAAQDCTPLTSPRVSSGTVPIP